MQKNHAFRNANECDTHFRRQKHLWPKLSLRAELFSWVHFPSGFMRVFQYSTFKTCPKTALTAKHHLDGYNPNGPQF